MGCFLMKDFDEQKQKTAPKIENLLPEDKNRLVGAFAWLLQEDKKQNPALYPIKKHKCD